MFHCSYYGSGLRPSVHTPLSSNFLIRGPMRCGWHYNYFNIQKMLKETKTMFENFEKYHFKISKHFKISNRKSRLFASIGNPSIPWPDFIHIVRVHLFKKHWVKLLWRCGEFIK